MSERARLSVSIHKTLRNRPIKMECTKFKKKQRKQKPFILIHGIEGYRIENDIKNSITRIHSVDDRTFPCHKAKALSLRLCCFWKLMDVLYIHWDNIANLLIYFSILLAFIHSPQTDHTITATQFIFRKFKINIMICSLLSFKTKQKNHLFIPNKSLMGT